LDIVNAPDGFGLGSGLTTKVVLEPRFLYTKHNENIP